MSERPAVALVGAGAMGGALAAGLVAAGWPADRITTVDASDDRRAELAALGYRVSADPAVAAEASVIVIAVKPQHVTEAAAPLRGRVGAGQLIITIAAGVAAATLEAAVGDVPVVRCMPNTPALVGEGMTAIAAGRHAGPEHVELASEVLGAVGRVVTVSEADLDAVTAVSGSGPAYVFLLAEALTDAAIEQGLAPDVAAALVEQTVAGAGRLLRESAEPASTLRERVTSPGGTTQAALEAFAAGGFRRLVADAVAAATRRSVELGES